MKIKRNLFRKIGSLKKQIIIIFIGEVCVFNSICRGYHLDFGDH